MEILMKTPLQILYEIVMRKEAPMDIVVIRMGLQKAMVATRNPRMRMVCNHLMCTDKTAADENGFGSLKFVVCWLRDNVSELYEVSAKIAIETAIKGDWPLVNAIRFLADTRLVGEYIPAMWKEDKTEELENRLSWVNQGSLRVAVNCSRRNLTNLAMKNGADIYVGASEEGGCIKAREGLTLKSTLTETLGTGWVQPYPDLIVTKTPQEDPGLVIDILNNEVVQERKNEHGLSRHNYQRNAQGSRDSRQVFSRI